MNDPYIHTKLFTKVPLRPEQMDNQLYINIKENLLDKLERKCYKNYGFISKIYSIQDMKQGIIEAENMSGSATFDVSFSCRLCRPVEGTKIVCKVTRVNRAIVTAENGPILVIIVNDKINTNVFFTDNNNILRYKSEGKSKRLETGDFVIISILNKAFNDRDEKIKVIGFLENIAKTEDVEKYYEDMYRNDETQPVVQVENSVV